MIAYLLDTNVISSFVRNPSGILAERLAAVGPTAVAINPIVAGELYFGLEKRRDLRLRTRIETVMAPLPVIAIEDPAGRHYGRIRADLERKGTPIGQNDLWIAAHALALDLTLVTDDMAEFRRVEGLRVENWLRS